MARIDRSSARPEHVSECFFSVVPDGKNRSQVTTSVAAQSAHTLLIFRGCVGILACNEDVKRVLSPEKRVVVKESDGSHPIGVKIARKLPAAVHMPMMQEHMNRS